MLVAVGLIVVGFAAGVLLTAVVALYVYGLLHANAVRAVESYGGAVLFTSISPIGAGVPIVPMTDRENSHPGMMGAFG